MTTFFAQTGQNTDGNDVIQGLGGADTIDAGLGVNTVYGGDGSDVITSVAGRSQSFYGDAGNDYMISGAGADLLSGGDGNDTLQGGAGSNTLMGDAGNDYLYVSGSVDRINTVNMLYGGLGDDVIEDTSWGSRQIFGGDGNDTAFATIWANGAAGSRFDGGLGTDALLLRVSNEGPTGTVVPSAVKFGAVAGGQDLVINGAVAAHVTGFESVLLNVKADSVALAGGAEADVFEVASAAGSIATGVGKDTVRLTGNIGQVALDGGAGIDLLQIDGSTMTSAMVLDISKATGAFSVGALALRVVKGFERLSFLSGAGDDVIRPGAGDDVLTGGAGRDDLYGGDGNDLLTGLRDETLSGGNGNDTLLAGDATDTTNAFNLLYGGAGNDSFQAVHWGNQRIYGGIGDDVITAVLHGDAVNTSGYYGGTGLDSLNLTIVADRADGSAMATSIAFDTFKDRQDLVINGVTAAHVDTVETLSLTAAVASATLTGADEVDNFTISHAVNAHIASGAGDDRTQVSHVSGTLALDGGTGTDLLIVAQALSDQAITLDMTTGVLTLGSAPAGSVTGFEKLILWGSSAADVVHAGAGDDQIGAQPGVYYPNFSPEAGNDLFDGGAGNDLICGGEGFDTLIGGTGNDILYGGSGNDLIYGGDGTDVITGGAGVDTLGGGLGSDTFVFQSVTDSGTKAGQIDVINFFTVAPGHPWAIDRIDLSAIDAVAASATSNEAFAYIGTAAFTGLGQVRAVQVGADTHIEVNNAGSLAADMKILLTQFTATQLGAEDFVL